MSASRNKLLIAFAAMMALLLLTMGCAYIPLGRLGIWLSFGIATCKTLLIAIVFMRLSTSTTSVRLAAAAGIVWLSVAVSFTMIDYESRGWHSTKDSDLGTATYIESLDTIRPENDRKVVEND